MYYFMNHERKNFLAIDLGASNGRIFIGRLKGYDLVLEEAHRFPNSIVEKNGIRRWDWQHLTDEIRKGLIKACEMTGNERIESVCCDSWSQDFGLLDENGMLFYEPVSYRDKRTEGLPEKFSDVIPPLELLKRNGSYISPITTLCQLYSMTRNEPEIISRAGALLFVADLINYSLCGEKQSDLTFASASQMHRMKNGDWDSELLEKLGIPSKILPPVLENPGVIGRVAFPDCPGKLLGIPVISGSGHDTSLASSAIFPMEKGTLFMSIGTWAMLGCCNGSKIDTDKINDTHITIMSLAWGKWALFGNGGVGMWLLEECIRKWAAKGISISYPELSDRTLKSRIKSIINVNDMRFFAPDDMPAEIVNACVESGQTKPRNPEDFAKVIFDSLTVSFVESVNDLRRITGMEFKGMNIVGGASRNNYLCSKIAEALGLTVTTGLIEATVAGNIILQAKVLNILKKEEEAYEVIKRSFPGIVYNPERCRI